MHRSESSSRDGGGKLLACSTKQCGSYDSQRLNLYNMVSTNQVALGRCSIPSSQFIFPIVLCVSFTLPSLAQDAKKTAEPITLANVHNVGLLSEVKHDALFLEIDLGEAQTASRVRILFAKGYPTDYEIAVAADGKDWTEVHRGAGTTNGKYEHAFAPNSARYVRALSYKPNGPGQEGGQMFVAELEVYEK